MTAHSQAYLMTRAARLEIVCGYAFDAVVNLGVLVAGLSVVLGRQGTSGQLAAWLVSLFGWVAPNIPPMYAVCGWRRVRLGIAPRGITLLMLLGVMPLLASLVPLYSWVAQVMPSISQLLLMNRSDTPMSLVTTMISLVHESDHARAWPYASAGAVTGAWFVACLMQGLYRPREVRYAVMLLEDEKKDSLMLSTGSSNA